jgi:hypothetical protein
MEESTSMSELYGKCPAQVDLCLPQGATWDLQMIWAADGVPVDLTSYTARMMLRVAPEDASPTVALSTTNGTMSVMSNGTIALNYSAASSSAVTAATYVYDMELVTAGGNVRRLIEGRAVVSREITR